MNGAAGGIGRACAQRFAAEGVVVANVDKEHGESAAAEVGGAFVVSGVSRRDDVDRLIYPAVAEYVTLGIALNAAGLNHRAFPNRTDEGRLGSCHRCRPEGALPRLVGGCATDGRSQPQWRDRQRLLGERRRSRSPEENQRKWLERMALGRVADCDEIARVAGFLASEDSSFTTGQTIYPDGSRMIQGFPRRMEA